MSVLTLLNPLKRYQLAAEGIAVAVVISACAWQFHEYSLRQQQVGYDRAQAEQAKVDKVRDDAQTKLDAFLNQRVFDAESKANERGQNQNALNAAVVASANSLQHAIDSVRASNGTATIEALRATNASLTTVFQDCAGKYVEVGKAADGHASDVQTLIDAWPTAPPTQAKPAAQ